MSDQPTISVEGVSKAYSSDAASDAIEIRSRSNKAKLVLSNINFELHQGQILGIIGNNGSGKSTLLKIIAGITKPSAGTVVTNGSVASILEIGTGFHPDLSGKDNVFLSGAILGMDDASLKEVYKDIVQFSGLQEFIDVPVKKYSSGMYMRLAFSVVAHVNADIVLLDEVFSVGDASFIRKSEKKLRELIDSNRTIIMASHDLNSISKIATSLLVLKNGKQQFFGSLEQGLTDYIEAAIFPTSGSEESEADFLHKNEPPQQENTGTESRMIHDESNSEEGSTMGALISDAQALSKIRYVSPRVLSLNLASETFTLNSVSIRNAEPYEVFNDRPVELCLDLTVHRKNNYQFAIVLSYNLQNEVLTSTPDSESATSLLLKSAGSHQVVFALPACLLNSGVYSFGVYLSDVDGKEVDKADDVFHFKVVFSESFKTNVHLGGHFPGPLVTTLFWSSL